jgi:fumarylacetoacetase
MEGESKRGVEVWPLSEDVCASTACQIAMESFLDDVPSSSGFGLHNLPYGVFSRGGSSDRRLGVRLGDHIVDLGALSKAGMFTGPILSKMGGSLQKASRSLKPFVPHPACMGTRSMQAAHHLVRSTPQFGSQGTLNEFMSLGKPAWQEARSTLQRLLSKQEGVLRDDSALRSAAIVPEPSCSMHLPASIGDYTDFYASKQHAFNCGALFRGAGNELQPNW